MSQPAKSDSLHPNVAAWVERRKRERRWEHDLERYTTIGRRCDHLRAVWDASKGQRISRWLRPENATRVAADLNGGQSGVVGWVYKIGTGA